MNQIYTLLTVMTLSLATAIAGVIDIGSRRELFVDRHMVDEISGDARLQLHRPEPREVVLVTGEPWEGNTSAYYTIFQDGDLYRMYYRGSNWDVEARKATHPEVTCYAESRDGINWTKPNLGIVEYEGSKQNNIILDGIGTHCFVAFKDGNPDAPPEARYKGISRGRPLGKKGLYVYQSPDGIHWSLIKDEPVITEGAFDSQNLAFWDPQIGKYREYHRIFVNRVRAIMTGTSDDFVNWTDPVLLKYPGAPNQHLYTNAIRAYHRAPHILHRISRLAICPIEGQRVEPIFMASRDGLTFHRWNDPVIPEDRAQGPGGKPQQLHDLGPAGTAGPARGDVGLRVRGLLRRAGHPVAALRLPQRRFRVGQRRARGRRPGHPSPQVLGKPSRGEFPGPPRRSASGGVSGPGGACDTGLRPGRLSSPDRRFNPDYRQLEAVSLQPGNSRRRRDDPARRGIAGRTNDPGPFPPGERGPLLLPLQRMTSKAAVQHLDHNPHRCSASVVRDDMEREGCAPIWATIHPREPNRGLAADCWPL